MVDYKKLFKFIETKKKEAVLFTKQLVEIPTVNPPGENYAKIIKVLEKKCRQLGLSTRKFVLPKKEFKKFNIKENFPRISLIADWNNNSDKTIHFSGHIDVVPAGVDWRTNPFKPVIKNNKIFARGAEDMKGTISAMLLAVEAIKVLGIKPSVNIQLSFVPDEEIGGHSGLGYLVKENLVNADWAIGEGYSGDFVSCGNKGVLWLQIKIKGKSSHACQWYKGINAFENMIDVGGELKKLKFRLQKRMTKYYTKNPKDRFASLVLGGDINGPNKVNMVPSFFSFSIDRRVLPEENIENCEKEIKNLIEKFNKKYHIEIKTVVKERAVVVNEDEPLCKCIACSIEKVFNKKAKFAVSPGGTDMRFFAYKDIPAIGYGAMGAERAHADDEFIYIDSILDTAKVYALTIANLA